MKSDGRSRDAPDDYTPTLRIDLLGGFRVAVDDRPIDAAAWRSRKAATLVKLLALAPGHRLHREQLHDILWPRLDTEAAGNNLRYTLHIARRVLEAATGPASRVLHSQDSHLALAPAGPLRVDVDDFGAAAITARRTGALADYQAALALYAGDLLPEDRYEDWVTDRREALRAAHLELLADVGQLHVSQGDNWQAIDALQLLLMSDPAHEESHVALMRLLALAGRRQEALRQYARLQQLLRQEVDAEPGPEAQQLADAISTRRFPSAEDGLQASDPEIADPTPGPPSNLPVPWTSFVGRLDELIELGKLLAPEEFPSENGASGTPNARGRARLVTLTGAGGSGKTRLAIAVAARLARQFPDGVWLVELAPLADPTLVPPTIAAVLDLRDSGEQPVMDVLKDYLRDKRLLLVLDNFEHLLDAAPLASELLAACPGITILITSRTLLHVRGEQEYPVSPLLAPPAEGDTDRGQRSVAELRRYPAVTLFVERAASVKAGFALTDANGSTVAAICTRLDGLPLALELAAMRIKLLPPQLLLARLNDRFSVLTGGPRDLPARQQTLRAAIAWSYDLLTEPEQSLFRRLAVFAGGCTIDAAENLGGEETDDESIPSHSTFPPSVLDCLDTLVDANLVRQIEEVDGERRFLMLETIREYGLEMLEEKGEAAAVRRRHAAWFLTVAEDFFIADQRDGQIAQVFRVERDLANFRTALAWAEEVEEVETGLRLASALSGIWDVRNLQAEGRGWLERALARDTGTPSRARAAALVTFGFLQADFADLGPAAAHVEEGIALARALGDLRVVAIALEYAGSIALDAEDYDRAEVLLEEAEVLSGELGYRMPMAYSRLRLGRLAQHRGELDRAVARISDALKLFREMGDSYGAAMALRSLGSMSRDRGNYGQAAGLYYDALLCWRETGHKTSLVAWLMQAAFLAATIGEHERAARWFGTVEMQSKVLDFDFSAEERGSIGQFVAEARVALGEEVFNFEYARGQNFSVEYATNEAEALFAKLASRDDTGQSDISVNRAS